MAFIIAKYRNIYTKYKSFPYQKLTGKNTLAYSGKIITSVDSIPDEYDSKKDYYFGCECNYSDWREIVKI